jgi:hypothetical protein
VLDAAPVATSRSGSWTPWPRSPRRTAGDPADLFATDVRTHAPATEVMGRVRQLADELGAAPEGQGNDTASRIAFMVGGYVGAGQLGQDDAIGTLLDAIAGWTYAEPGDARTTENTIMRQVEEGAKHPRPWEAARFQDGATRTAPPW